MLGGGLVARILAAGTLIAAASLGAGLIADGRGWHVPTVIFATLGLAQLGLALALRAPRHGAEAGERGLEVAVLIAAGLQVLALTWSPLRDLLGTEAVPVAAWTTALVAAAIPGVVVAIVRRASRVIKKEEAQ